jgi:flagellar biosynthetic protein FlhB
MSKQEQGRAQEQRGRPEVKQRIRQLQPAGAAQRAQAVPTADVVIVNPEHYAVALRYDERRAEAPMWWPRASTRWRCTSARWRARPGEVLELPPLARAIYRTSQVQQQIPSRSTRPWPRC